MENTKHKDYKVPSEQTESDTRKHSLHHLYKSCNNLKQVFKFKKTSSVKLFTNRQS